MKTLGIIAEYNPFHNGHAYQIKEAKRRTGAKTAVIAMSGDFVQRGAPAVIDKYARAAMALAGGADLVVELPVLWAASSAEQFAMAGVTLFDQMGCVDGLCFGAETDDLPLLETIADILAREPEAFKNVLRQRLKEGCPFPKARELALNDSLNTCGYSTASGETERIAEILKAPNNILAIEYLKAISKRHSKLKPVLLKRVGADYHDPSVDLSKNVSGASATAIRRQLLDLNPNIISVLRENGSDSIGSGMHPNRSNHSRDSFSPADCFVPAAKKSRSVFSKEEIIYFNQIMPASAVSILVHYLNERPALKPDDFSAALGYRLLSLFPTGYLEFGDSSSQLSNRLAKNLFRFQSFSQFCLENKSKDITYTRISRLLLHILLDIRDEHYTIGKMLDYIPYLRILGFRRDSASGLLRDLKQSAAVPVISKLANASSLLPDDALSLLQKDIFAADLYEQTASFTGSEKKMTLPRSEYTREIVIL